MQWFRLECGCAERVAAPTASELHSNGFMDTSGRMPGAMAGASPSTQSAGVGVSRGVSPVSGSMPASPAHPAVDALSRPQSANYLGVRQQAPYFLHFWQGCSLF